MSALVDVLAGLAGGGGTTMRVGTSASGGKVSVGGAEIVPARWINPPAAAGEPVVVLLGRGLCVAVGGAGAPPPALRLHVHDDLDGGPLMDMQRLTDEELAALALEVQQEQSRRAAPTSLVADRPSGRLGTARRREH